MTIRRKIFIVIGLTLVSLLFSLQVIASLVLRNGFSRIERRDADENMARVQAALDDSLTKISNTAGDWAWWDDTYRFVSDQNPAYARANLGAASIATLDFNTILFVRPSGKIVFGTAFDLQKGRKKPLSPALQRQLLAQKPLFERSHLQDSRQGLLLLPQGPVLIASRAILTSDKQGPSRGTLIFSRDLNQDQLKGLMAITRLPLQLQRVDAPLPADFQAVASALSSSHRTTIRFADENELRGYALLDDIYGKPALIMRVSMPRSVHIQETRTLQYLSLSLLVACCTVWGVTFVLLEKLVLCRLEELEENVRGWTQHKNVSQRVPVMGSDELGTLASGINELLAQVESSHRSLSESENRFRTFMDNSPSIAFVKDSEGHMLYVNTTFERQLRKKSADVLGKTDDQIWPPEIAKNLRGHDLKVLQSGKVLEVEETVPVPNRPDSHWLVFKFPIADQSGQMFVGGMAVDITERKAVERLKSEFVSTVSHELRTPLTSINGSLELLGAGVVVEMPTKARPLLDMARRNCQRLMSLINDLLDMEKIESGNMAFHMQRLPLAPLLQSALAINQAYAANLNVRLLLSETVPDVEITVDADRFTQVLTNLLSNACKFSPPEGVVELRAFLSQPDRVKVAISNRGPVIPLTFQKRIFEKFAQADASDTRQKGGTGLGLSISKSLVEKMDGKIGLESSDSEGTIFAVEFAVAPSVTPAVVPAVPPSVAPVPIIETFPDLP